MVSLLYVAILHFRLRLINGYGYRVGELDDKRSS